MYEKEKDEKEDGLGYDVLVDSQKCLACITVITSVPISLTEMFE